jgi:flavin reductase (DIM6/NTAB) family NADH-FMN oxidoreductase RutF
MTVDQRDLRDCLGHFATGVTVVTCLAGGEPHGATVNAFTAVSLDPPLVAVAIARRARACGYLDGAPFAVNVLRRTQDGLAHHFAGRGRAEVTWVPGPVPRLAGALAYLTCTPWRCYDGGDHLLFLGLVTDLEHHGGDPLVFYRGTFRPLGEPFAAAPPWLGSLDSPDAGWLPAPSTRGA